MTKTVSRPRKPKKPRARASRRTTDLDARALDTIIAAVGIVGPVCAECRNALQRDLGWAASFYETNSDLRKRPRIREGLEEVDDLARRLKKRLSQEWLWGTIGRHYPLTATNPVATLDHLISAVKESAKSPPPDPPEGQILASRFLYEFGIGTASGVSPVVWLVGGYLPPIFERHFAQPATQRTADGEANTPCVRFAQTVLSALGIHRGVKQYAAESIVKAMTIMRRRYRSEPSHT